MSKSSAIKNPLLFMLCMASATFMAGVDLMVIGVAIDPMRKYFHVDVTVAQWLMTAFAIGCAACYIGVGRISDHYGKRRTLIIGIFIFGLSSLIVALSTNIWLAIVFRFIQGAGIATVINSANSLVMEYYDADERPKKIAFLISGTGLGFSLGPIIGGILLNYFDWRSLFYINIPFAIFAFFTSLHCIPRTGHKTDVNVNFLSLAFLTISVVFLSIFASQCNAWGWGSWQTWTSLAIFVILFILFVINEKIHKPALIDASLFKLQNVIAGCVSGLLLYIPIVGYLLIFGLYFQDAYGLNRIQSGLAFLPYAAGFVIVPPLAAKLMKVMSHKTVIVLGFFIATVALPFSNIITPTTPYIELILPFLIFSIGGNMVNTSTLPVCLQFVPPDHHGVASGLAMNTRWLGGALGTAILSAIFTAGLKTSPTHAVHLCIWTLTGITTFATIFSYIMLEHTT